MGGARIQRNVRTYQTRLLGPLQQNPAAHDSNPSLVPSQDSIHTFGFMLLPSRHHGGWHAAQRLPQRIAQEESYCSAH